LENAMSTTWKKLTRISTDQHEHSQLLDITGRLKSCFSQRPDLENDDWDMNH